MAEMTSHNKKNADNPPAYVINDGDAEFANKVPKESGRRAGCSRCALIGWVIGIATALLVVLAVILGGVYFHLLQESIVRFQLTDNTGSTPIFHDVEINSGQQIAVFRMSGPDVPTGLFTILDYGKSMIGMYHPTTHACYVNGGITRAVADLETYKKGLIPSVYNMNDTTTTMNYFKISDSYPITDKSILPNPLQSVCANLPVYWMEPARDTTNLEISKRSIDETRCIIGAYFIIPK